MTITWIIEIAIEIDKNRSLVHENLLAAVFQ